MSKQGEASLKRYKVYDKLYANYRNPPTEAELEEAKDFTCWTWVRKSWSPEEVHHAVYEAFDFLEWQKFRVGLKGCPTNVKLLRLHNYLRAGNAGELLLRRCRVDNYIGALVRGGFLSTPDLYILK
jgi:hypothetical protein